MATPRDIRSYPLAYFLWFGNATRGEVRISCGSPARAERQRKHLYAFREAMYRQPDYVPLLTLQAPHLTFKLEADKLVIMSKEISNASRTNDSGNQSTADQAFISPLSDSY